MFSFPEHFANDDLAMIWAREHVDLHARQVVLASRRWWRSGQEGGPNGRSDQEVGASLQTDARTHAGNITAIRPMKDGVIADFTVTEQMLKHFIRKCTTRASSSRAAHDHLRAVRLDRRAPRVTNPPGAGASRVHLIEPMVSDRRGPPGRRATGSMVVDIGGGTAEVGVISLGAWYTRDRCASAATSSTGDHQLYPPQLRHADQETTAEQSRRRSTRRSPVQVRGRSRDAISRRASAQLRSQTDTRALTEPLNQIVSAVKSALQRPRRARAASPKGHGADRRRRAPARHRPPLMETGLPVIIAGPAHLGRARVGHGARKIRLGIFTYD
jgi:rod shape-determining protein MreB